MNPMSTAPINEAILLLAKWTWADGPGATSDQQWRVAEFYSEGWCTVTSNPYKDEAVEPIGWLPLPETEYPTSG